jgi:hypothetical protein
VKRLRDRKLSPASLTEVGKDVSESLDRTSAGRVLLERNVRPHLIVIGGVFRKDAPKMLGVEHDHMIRALAPDRAVARVALM